MQTHDILDLHWTLAVIQKYLKIILLCTIIGGLVVLLIITLLPKKYQASVTILIDPSLNSNINEYNSLIAGERLALTYSKMMQGRELLNSVITKLKLNEDPDQLANRVTVEPIKDTQLLLLSVTDSSPKQAALIANTLADEVVSRISETQIARYSNYFNSQQDKVDALTKEIDTNQSELDKLTSQNIEKGSEIIRLNDLLTNYHSDFQSLQQSYKNLQINLTDITNKIHIVESAHLSDNSANSNNLASVTLLLDQSLINGGTTANTPSSEKLVSTYGPMIKRKDLLNSAIQKAGAATNYDELKNQIQVLGIPNTQTIQIKVTDKNGSQALNLVDAIAQVFITQVQSQLMTPYLSTLTGIQGEMDVLNTKITQTQESIKQLSLDKVKIETEQTRVQSITDEYRKDLTTLTQDFNQFQLSANKSGNGVMVVEDAPVPDKPLSTNRLMVTILSMIGIFLLTSTIAIVYEYLLDPIKNSDDINRITGLKTIGSIGLLNNGDEELVVFTNPRSPNAEAFRMLASNIRLACLDRQHQTLLITSAHDGEGKSISAANLAIALAQTGLQVILIDADLYFPRLHELFKLEQGDGLVEALLDGHIEGRLKHTKIPGLNIVTSGQLPANPIGILGSPSMKNLVDQLSENADIVIIDSAPVLAVADVRVLASTIDNVLLVFKAGKTLGQAVRDAVESLRQVQVNILGVFLNSLINRGTSPYYQYNSITKKDNVLLDFRKTLLMVKSWYTRRISG
jgi:capsular exopolysaccharide synthesis family protein